MTLTLLKVTADDINEIWSFDLTYVDKLSPYNNGVNYLLVAVDIFSRKIRVQPYRFKGAEETTREFGCMITKSKPMKVRSDKESELKGASKRYCESKSFDTYTIKVKRNWQLQSAKIDLWKTSSTNFWTIGLNATKKLQSFVFAISSRITRVTGLASNEFSTKHRPYLISQIAEKLSKLIKKPNLKPRKQSSNSHGRYKVQKRYNQRFTDEVFQITKNATFNPPTFFLIDSIERRHSGDVLGARVDKNLVELDEFYIFFESTGSMET